MVHGISTVTPHEGVCNGCILGKNHCWSRHVWRTSQQARKNNVPHFEEKQHSRQDLRKSDANVDKPSLVRVRVLGWIVRVSNPFLYYK